MGIFFLFNRLHRSSKFDRENHEQHKDHVLAHCPKTTPRRLQRHRGRW
jgi:hypothetical protein